MIFNTILFFMRVFHIQTIKDITNTYVSFAFSKVQTAEKCSICSRVQGTHVTAETAGIPLNFQSNDNPWNAYWSVSEVPNVMGYCGGTVSVTFASFHFLMKQQTICFTARVLTSLSANLSMRLSKTAMFLRVLNIFIQLESGAYSDHKMKFRLSILAGRRRRVKDLKLT